MQEGLFVLDSPDVGPSIKRSSPVNTGVVARTGGWIGADGSKWLRWREGRQSRGREYFSSESASHVIFRPANQQTRYLRFECKSND